VAFPPPPPEPPVPPLLSLPHPIDERPAENTPSERNMSGTATFFSIRISLKLESTQSS
jgi:hypothetical protein